MTAPRALASTWGIGEGPPCLGLAPRVKEPLSNGLGRKPWRTEVGTPEIGWGAGEVPPRPRTTAATHARYCRARAIRKFECRQTLAVLQRNCASSHANIDPACVGLLQVERSPPQNQVRSESGNSSPGVPCTADGEE